MKKFLVPLLVLVAGAGVGTAAAYGTGRYVGAAPGTQTSEPEEPQELAFVPASKVVAPLVLPDGRLSGYVSFDLELQVLPDDTEFVTERLPLLLHAINMQTYRTPMAAGPNGMLPDLQTFRAVVMNAAPSAFGPGRVRKVAITQAVPA